MKYVIGQNREQLHIFPVSLDESISKDNEVRIIDLFVASIDVKTFGFKVDYVENGRPAYHPAEEKQGCYSYQTLFNQRM